MRDLLAALAELRERLKEIPQADERRLSDLKTEILGRKAGALTQILGRLPTLDPPSKREVGAAANALKRDFEAAFGARERELKRAAGTVTGVDLTMPSRPGWQGGLHLVTQVVDEICEIFRELGFTRAVGPEAETERYNFFALNFPKDHPALDAQDSFYLSGDVLLRTHTSPVQIRTLERYPPPIRVVIPGQVYRRDPFDASHSPVFQQIEGLAVDEGITFVHGESFDLLEHRGVRGIERIATVHLPRDHDPDGWRVPLEGADLDRGGVGAEQHVPGQIERVLGVEGRVVLGEVEGEEVVALGLGL